MSWAAPKQKLRLLFGPWKRKCATGGGSKTTPRVWELSFSLRWKLELLSCIFHILQFHVWLPVFRKNTDSSFTVKYLLYFGFFK